METLSSSGSLLSNAAMPPPPSPSASSSSVLGKRRRSGIPAIRDLLPSEETYRSGPGSFTESTKQQIENLNGGDSCWCCAMEDNNICHVIARGSRRVICPQYRLHNIADRVLQLFKELHRRRLLTLESLHEASNGISLCSMCHKMLDSLDLPGFVFFPTDLEYFLEFERKDFERRQQLQEETGQWPVRAVPRAQDYLHHQAHIVGSGTVGGLYRRMFLRPLAGISAIGEDPRYPPKSWHGCPLASLTRAFHSLGSQAHLFPPEIRQNLRDLQDLYGYHDQLAGVIPTTEASSGETAPPQPTVDDYTPFAPLVPPSSSTRNTSWSAPGRRSEQAEEAKAPSNLPRKRAHSDIKQETPSEMPATKRKRNSMSPWVWGPTATSNDKASFYRDIRSLKRRSSSDIDPTNANCTGQNDGGASLPEHNITPPKAAGDVKVSRPKEEIPAIDSVLPSPQASAG